MLGSNATDKRHWTAPELEILENHAHLKPLAIQKRLEKAGFRRTLTAIATRIKRFHGGITQNRLDAGLYNANGVGYLLGVDRNSVLLWINKGWLKAKRAGLSEREDDQWEIKAKDLRDFVINNAARVNGAKCDMVWLIDLLTNYHANGH